MKTFSEIFLVFSKLRFNFEHFQKNDDPSSSYICKCVKGQVSEDLSTSKMVNGPKHSLNLKDFIILIDPFEDN